MRRRGIDRLLRDETIVRRSVHGRALHIGNKLLATVLKINTHHR